MRTEIPQVIYFIGTLWYNAFKEVDAMRFQLDVTLTEDDYLEFNYFHGLQSKQGKKAVKKSRIFCIAIMVILILIVLFMDGLSVFSVVYSVFIIALSVLYMLIFIRICKRNIKLQISITKKRGKLPYAPASTMEFYEDKFVEVTPDTRTERGYGVLERICVVDNRFVCLYDSSISAYILPIPQIASQLDQAAFLDFLSQKCSNVERY